MFKNKSIKQFTLIHLGIFVVSLIFSFIFSKALIKYYNQELILSHASLVGNILDKYPSLESDVIDSIKDNHVSNGLNVLKKYGLDDIDNLKYLKNHKQITDRIIIFNFLFTLVLFAVLETVYFIFLFIYNRKLKDMDTYMTNILNNDYSMDIREYSEGSMSNLKNDIYKMTVKLKEQTENSKRDKKYLEETISDISHQLKTPLTSMYVINDILSDEKTSSEVKKEFLNKNRSQLERIEWLVTSLLKLSRLDSGSIVLKKDNIRVKELITAAIEPLKIPVELKNIDLQVECRDDIFIIADFNWTLEALVNIIKNACEHTKENGQIIIKATTNPIYTEIIISDNGEGIDSQVIPHIFERFYRGNTSKESIGIGLNMAKKIIDMQNGDILVTSKLNEGTTFYVKIYKNYND